MLRQKKTSIRHIALKVPDLQAAEEYYRSLLDMELIGREVELEDGNWYSLPPDKSWDDAENAGIQLGMTALRKGDIVLALFHGQVQLGQVFAIGLTLPIEEIANIRERLPDITELIKYEPRKLMFRDPYQITWQISVRGDEFKTTGNVTGRWLDL